jgi:hypothetical protein
VYRLTSQKARTSQPRKPFSGATVRIRIIIAVLPSFSHVSPHARRLAQGKDGDRERAHVLLGGCRVAMPYRGGRGKSRGCFALDKEGITQCNRKNRNRKKPRKRKSAYKEKRQFVREKKKGVKKVKGKNSMNKEKRMLFEEKKREEEERKNK